MRSAWGWFLVLLLSACSPGKPPAQRPHVEFPPPQPVSPPVVDPLWVKADGGDPVAQYNLALRLEGEKRMMEAARYYRMAALQGLPEAQFNFALMQADGQGVPRNEEAAFVMLKNAATGGLAEAQFNAGVWLSEGRGTRRVPAEGAKWLRQASVQGHGEARVYYAGLVLRGEVLALTGPQVAELARWVNDEALKGDKGAQFYMGLMSARGLGVQPNQAEAYFWLEVAARQGVEAAARGRDLVAEKLTVEQVRQIRARAEQFHPLARPVAPPR